MKIPSTDPLRMDRDDSTGIYVRALLGHEQSTVVITNRKEPLK